MRFWLTSELPIRSERPCHIRAHGVLRQVAGAQSAFGRRVIRFGSSNAS